MERFESLERLAAKIEWEGGLEESFSYGITSDMMPEGDEVLKELWADAERLYSEFSQALNDLVEAYPGLVNC